MTWRGNRRNQCAACEQYFASLKAFDRHRAGRFGTGPFGTSPERRCISPDEMRRRGWSKDEKGFWWIEKGRYPSALKGRSQRPPRAQDTL